MAAAIVTAGDADRPSVFVLSTMARNDTALRPVTSSGSASPLGVAEHTKITPPGGASP
jgi:hypothetical protein